MTDYKRTLAIAATDVPTRTKVSNYPEPFFTRMAKRKKKALGEYFGLKNFGVNLDIFEALGYQNRTEPIGRGHRLGQMAVQIQ